MNITELKINIILIRSRLLKHSSSKSKQLIVDDEFKSQLWTIINILDKHIDKFETIQSFIKVMTEDLTERVDELENLNWKRDHLE